MGGVVAGGSVAASHSFSGEDSTTSVLSVKKVRRGGPGRGKKVGVVEWCCVDSKDDGWSKVASVVA